ncbi:putative bifunctional diguanylate cyclase/phosphodiesterase [Sphingomonas astaxanthinifaciens]|uniref:putative bifunctional diguanylate cyclase/phosphodiesterase n=1 Tax=Sphingomonas astaxanthinifaciens TaxID=407019 RepID=UPI00068ACE4A|nr:EAL domain-containing protein [Sphingomonas astaxanthinifaciens]
MLIRDVLTASERPGRIRLLELCFIAPPGDALGHRVRQGQIDSLVRLVPLTIAVNLLAALVLGACLWPIGHHGELLAWAGVFLGFCVLRLSRVWRLRRDPAYASRNPPSLRTILPPIFFLSLLWVVPVLAWFDGAPPQAQVIMVLVLFGMASGASVTLSSVPPAALTYVGTVTIAGLVSMSRLGEITVLILLPLFAGLLTYAVLWNARQFAGHLAASLELREKAELINILREFDASGSEWLWELGPDLALTRVSSGLADALGRTPESLIGLDAVTLLDPVGRVAAVSTGMRTIVDALRSNRPFRDVAIPAMSGRQWWSLSGKPLFDHAGAPIGWRGVGSDITASRLTGHDSVTAARHDHMTGLANRLLIRELLEEALLRRRAGRGSCAMMLVDLDRFKLVNDTLGHGIGDELLCEVARRLEQVAAGTRVGRLGGDEFALVLTATSGRAELSSLAEEIIRSLSAPYRIGSADLNIGATIGIAVAPSDGVSQETLIRSADLALYSAKKAKRGSFHFFAPWMAEQAAANRALESDLRQALNIGQLSLAYQPIVHARSHKVIAREALLRWTHPVRGEVPPDLFVPVIEDAGLIGQVGNWVLREACREAAAWKDRARVAVNVSSAQLAAGPVLVGHVIQALGSSGLPAERLELEVTESIFLADDSTTRATLEQLRAIGVRLVLDDFGMGYSNFVCLANGEFSKVKIDRSFTAAAALPGHPAERAIVESILTLARGLRLEVTAEGIETVEQAAQMTAMGCGQLQGYLFGRPTVPASRAEGLPEPAPVATLRPRPYAA